MFDGVLFDFNGTLLQDTPYHIKAFARIARESFHYDMSAEEFTSVYAGLPNQEILRRMSGDTLSYEEREVLSLRKEAYYREMVREAVPRARLTNGAEELFGWLQEQNIPYTIVSASIRENIEFFVEWFSLRQWFDPARIIYDTGEYVSKKEMYRKAAEIMGMKHPLVFEDSLSGVSSALEIGASVIFIEGTAKLPPEYTVLASRRDMSDCISLLQPLLRTNRQ